MRPTLTQDTISNVLVVEFPNDTINEKVMNIKKYGEADHKKPGIKALIRA